MPSVRIAVSGLQECLQIAWPYLSQVSAAFTDYGIDISFVRGETLPEDPEDVVGGWSSLVARLEAASKPTGTANLVITRAPPQHVGTINGMLLDTDIRGVAAVYLDADVYHGQPANRPDVLVQVCIHEIGHLLDLTHADARDEHGFVDYTNALLPEYMRENQDFPLAWGKASADAQSRGEPPLRMPDPMLYFPFSAKCRACLRAASQDSRWLPYQGPFRGISEGSGSNQDQSLHTTIGLHNGSRIGYVGAPLYLAIKVKNKSTYPVQLPAHLSPNHGALDVTVQHENGTKTKYRRRQLACSDAVVTIVPGKSAIHNISLIPDESNKIFTRPGMHKLVISIINHHRSKGPVLGTASMNVTVKVDKYAEALGQQIAKLTHDPHGVVSAKSLPSVTGRHPHFQTHLTLLQASRRGTTRKNRITLEGIIESNSPVPLRHLAARQLALDHLNRHYLIQPKKWHQFLSRLREVFYTPDHQELHAFISQMERGWKNHRQTLALR